MSDKSLDFYMSLPYAVKIIEDDDVYFAEVEELEGCMTQGYTKTEAEEMILDAKKLWLATAIEEGIEIPMPKNYRGDY